MTHEITILDDGTVAYVSHYAPGRGSLSALGAQSLVDKVNLLDRTAVLLVLDGVTRAPFGAVLFPEEREAQEQVARFREELLADTERLETNRARMARFSLGELRQYLVVRFSGGCNAPGDLWIRAVAIYQASQGVTTPPAEDYIDPNQTALDFNGLTIMHTEDQS